MRRRNRGGIEEFQSEFGAGEDDRPRRNPKPFLVSPQTAREVLYYLAQNDDSPAQAAHDVDLSRTAIAPYTAQPLERAYATLRRMASLNPERLAQWKAKLTEIASEAGPPRHNGRNRFTVHKGIVYFRELKEAQRQLDAAWEEFPEARIVQYGRGFAIQIRKSGDYLGPNGRPAGYSR